MEFIHYLQQNMLAALTITGFVTLCIGSFLNVVIYRLPLILEREYRTQCKQLLDVKIPREKPLPKFNLWIPRSHCPNCQHTITVLENIPLLSYLWLKGRCAYCNQIISWRYPIVELGCAVLSLFIVWHFGISWQTAGALLLTWGLLCLVAIDFDHQLLPDNLTYPLLWLGLLFNLFNVFTDLHSAVIGAVIGYLCLWAVAWVFRLVTGKQGMGHGDFKLLAVFGAWLGWQSLLSIILISSFLGSIIGGTLILFKLMHRHKPIPFGPFLAFAGWVVLLWGDNLTHWYGVMLG